MCINVKRIRYLIRKRKEKLINIEKLSRIKVCENISKEDEIRISLIVLREKEKVISPWIVNSLFFEFLSK